MNVKQTKHALFTSVLSLLLCISMLIGTTFAWFTDSVISGKNKIVAGNLDIELEYATEFDESGNPTKWTKVNANTSLFNESSIWEPGHTETSILKITNKGNLALKYKMYISKEEKYGISADGLFYLSDYLVFNRTEDATKKSREKYWDAAREDLVLNDGKRNSNPTFGDMEISETSLEAGQEKIFTLAIYMPTSVGNEANYTTSQPSITFGLNLVATQLDHESDSFGDDYDANSKYEWDGKSETAFEDLKKDDTEQIVFINHAEDFVGAVKNYSKLKDYTLKLTAPINLNDKVWSSKTISNITIDGNGKTISGLNVASGVYAGLFSTITNVTIKDLTVKGSASGRNVGGIASQAMNSIIENCVSEVTINATAKAGGIVNLTDKTATIRNCVNKAPVNGAGPGVGGIVGYANKNTTIIGCENTNTVTSTGSYTGGIVGYATGGEIVVEKCVNKGAVNGVSTVGGIVSFFSGGSTNKVIDCVNSGVLTGTSGIGALVGVNNATVMEISFTEKTKVENYLIVSNTSAKTTLTNVIGEIRFSGNGNTLYLEDTELTKLTISGGGKDYYIHADEGSYVNNLMFENSNAVLRVAAGSTLKLGSYTGNLRGEDSTSVLVLDGVMKNWDTETNNWK